MSWLTQNDVNNYGSELIDLTQRSALHALAPELQDIRQQNAELQRRLAQEARHRLDQALEAAVPNYREIDRDAGWHRWLLGYDALSGAVRQQLLNSAIQRGDSTSVIAFFKSYQREGGGHSSGSAATTSGGRTRSSGNKPTYSRAQIAQLYESHRKGQWTGREGDWQKLEHDIIRAGAEGRILGAVDVAGK